MSLKDLEIKLPDADPTLEKIDPDAFLKMDSDYQDVLIVRAMGWTKHIHEHKEVYLPPRVTQFDFEYQLDCGVEFDYCPDFMIDLNSLQYVKDFFTQAGYMLCVYIGPVSTQVDVIDGDGDLCGWGAIQAQTETLAICLTLLYAQGLLTHHPNARES